MKKHSNHVIILAALLACAGAASAAGRNFGLGLEIGNPDAFSAKLWTSSRTALDFALGWSDDLYGSGYYDQRCYNPGFRANNPGYCADQNFDNYNYGYGYGYRSFHVHADYLFHSFDVIRTSERFPIYYGPGLSFNYVDYNYGEFGIRGELGIAWMPKRAPFDVFFEIAPVLELFRYPNFDFNGDLGARFYF